jgi:hypothetical protein
MHDELLKLNGNGRIHVSMNTFPVDPVVVTFCLLLCMLSLFFFLFSPSLASPISGSIVHVSRAFYMLPINEVSVC